MHTESSHSQPQHITTYGEVHNAGCKCLLIYVTGQCAVQIHPYKNASCCLNKLKGEKFKTGTVVHILKPIKKIIQV